MIAPYAVCCYFWTHLLRADCSFNYFCPIVYIHIAERLTLYVYYMLLYIIILQEDYYRACIYVPILQKDYHPA